MKYTDEVPDDNSKPQQEESGRNTKGDVDPRYFKRIDTATRFNFVQLASVVMWSLCVWILVGSLRQTRLFSRFLPYLALAASIPYVTVVINIAARLRAGNTQPHAPPEYPACMKPTGSLSDEEKAKGVVATADGHCVLTQHNYLQSVSEVIRVKAYNLMYALFSLVLLFFTFSGYKRMLRADDPFIRESIRIASMLSLILFTTSVLGSYYWFSLFVTKFYNNVVQMNVSAVIILVSYLLYGLVINKG